jgi:hypothetical protein
MAPYLVSLTTYYPRFNYAHTAIESVLNQQTSHKYDVHLYLAKADIAKNGGNVPPNIEALTRQGLKIFIEKENFLSYKKLVYALKTYPEKTIITVDDDVIYPADLLDRLIQKSQEFPNCIVCSRGHFLSFDSRGRLQPYHEMKAGLRPYTVRRTLPSLSLLPTGVHGVLYPPFAFDEMAMDHEQFMSLCPYADDIWFKMASLKKGTPCVQVDERNSVFPDVPNLPKMSLADFNIVEGKNDLQFQACFTKYPDLLEKVREECLKLEAIGKISKKAMIWNSILLMELRMNIKLREKRKALKKWFLGRFH